MDKLDLAVVSLGGVFVRPRSRDWEDEGHEHVLHDGGEQRDGIGQRDRDLGSRAGGDGERRAEHTADHHVGRHKGADGLRTDEGELEDAANDDALRQVSHDQADQGTGHDRVLDEARSQGIVAISDEADDSEQ